MNKVFSLILILVCLQTGVFAFGKKEKPTLFLTTHDPRISRGVAFNLENQSVFKRGKKIYFLVDNPKGFKSDYIRYQIVRQDDNAHVGGYSRERNILKRVRDKNSYVDYFVLHRTGKYIIQVFDAENVHQWIIYGEFRVVE